MRTCSAGLGCALLAWALGGWAGAEEARWIQADPQHAWSFPRDHWAHPGYGIEWWYVTGHLRSTGEPSRGFGFQLTFFRVGLVPESPALESAWSTADLILAHAAITDKAAGRHRSSELLFREAPFLAGTGGWPDPEIAWSRPPAGTAGRWSVRWNGEAFDLSTRDDRAGFGFELETRPLKPLVLQGPNGYSRKAERQDAASLYYSFTRLDVRGRIGLDGRSIDVRGQAWMDHEFSTSQLTDEQVGWDWFSLQLDDGRELMLYELRRADGAVDFGRGTLVAPDGSPRYIGPEEWRVEVLDRWKSPESGARYPSSWRIAVPGENLVLEIRPDVADQELRGRVAGGVDYWEGAVSVRDGSGRQFGQGYVELTGYAEGSRPPL